MIRLSLLFLFFTVFYTARVSGSNCTFTDGTDPFECFNNSTCKVERYNLTELAEFLTVENLTIDIKKEYERNGRHCGCLKGWTGLRCNTKFESCGVRGHTCYNGGACIAGVGPSGNSQLYCDCTRSVEHVNGTTINYVGKYCEEPSVSDDVNNDTSSCNSDKSIFCVNGGTCKSDYLTTPQRPCICHNNYEGPHCEFVIGTVPDCTLQCQNNGVCLLGIRTYVAKGDEFLQEFFANHTNYQYCDCPTGFYGPSCETKSVTCGPHRCFNGGTCVEKSTSNGINYNCDCSKDDNADKSYAGKFCQYESTKYCDNSKTENGQLFCVNNGTCKAGSSHYGCDCPTGFHGPICEFKGDESTPICNLTCENNGVCRSGAKDLSYLDKYGHSLAHFNVSYNENFEHCVCPAGFLGLTCEHEVVVCGDGKHACFHGTKCIDEEGSNSTCDCQAGFTTFDKFAGKYCEHKQTTICTANDKDSIGLYSLAFCVNDGKCKAVASAANKGHPGCTCTDAWAGEHCEFLKSEYTAINAPQTGSSSNRKSGVKGFGIFILVTGSLLLAFGSVFYYLRIKKRKSAMNNMPGPDDNIAPSSGVSVFRPHASSSEIVLDLGPNKDLDGNVLHNVDII